MADLIDLDKPCTQERFAELLGISQPAIHAQVAAGTLRKRAPLREWLIVMHKVLADAKAGHSSDLASQRARLAKEQADKVERENAVRAGQLIPAEQLTRALADIAGQAIPLIEALPGQIRMRQPDAPVSFIKVVEDELVKLRNTWAAIEPAKKPARVRASRS
jgi:phage terminase Nu1 subunit (DNA packaging protein)